MKDTASLGKYFAIALEIAVLVTALVFLGIHSFNFFSYTFTGENQLYAWLGFALTSGGLIAYIVIYKWNAPNNLKRLIALCMILICLFGELATAGFGMHLGALREAGREFTDKDINSMILAVQALGFLHALAGIMSFAGQKVIEDFKRKPEAIEAPVDSVFAKLQSTTDGPASSGQHFRAE